MASEATTTPSKADSLSREQLVKYIRKLRSDLSATREELKLLKSTAPAEVSLNAPDTQPSHTDTTPDDSARKEAEEELFRCKAENDDLRAQLAAAQGAVASEAASAALAAEKAQLLEKLKKVKPALQRAQATKAQLIEAESALAIVRKELQATRDELDSRTAEFEQRGQALQTARSSVIALQKELASAQSATTNTTESATQAQEAAEKRVAELRKQIDQLKADAASAATAHADELRCTREEADAKLQEAQAAAKQDAARLQDAVAAAEARTAEARRECAALQAQLHSQQEAAGSCEANASQMQEHLQAAQDENKAAKAALAKQQRALRQLKLALRNHTGSPAWMAQLATLQLPQVHITTAKAAAGVASTPPPSPGPGDDAPPAPPVPASLHAHLEVQGGGEQWHLLAVPTPPKSVADLRSSEISTTLRWVPHSLLEAWRSDNAPPAEVAGQALRCTSDAHHTSQTTTAFGVAACSIAHLQCIDSSSYAAGAALGSVTAAIKQQFTQAEQANKATQEAAQKREAQLSQQLDAATSSLAEYKSKAQAAMRRGGGADAALRRAQDELADTQEQLADSQAQVQALQVELREARDALAQQQSLPAEQAPRPVGQPDAQATAALEAQIEELQDALAAAKGEQRRLASITKGHAKVLKEAVAAARQEEQQSAAVQAADVAAQLAAAQEETRQVQAQLRTAKSEAVEQSAEIDALRMQLASMSKRQREAVPPATAPVADPELSSTGPVPPPVATAPHGPRPADTAQAALEAAVGAALASPSHAGHEDGQLPETMHNGADSSHVLRQLQQQLLEVQGQLSDARDEAGTYRQQLHKQTAELAQLRAAVHDMRTAAAREEELFGGAAEEEEGGSAAVPSSPGSVTSTTTHRSQARAVGSSTQLVYLKNALVSWATAREVGDKRRMLPALRTLLKLSPQDEARIQQALQEEASVSHGLQSAGMGLLSSVFG